MMRGLLDVEGGGAALPFVRMFFGSPSEYLWEDDEGTVHRIPQGEWGEQGDAMMPLLFAVGQHRALEATHRRMNPGEFLMAFHDDVYMAIPPARVGPMHAVVQEEVFVHACTGCITGRLRCGTRPECVPLLATHWSALPGPTIPKVWVHHPHSAAGDQGVGGRPLDIKISLPPSWSQCEGNTRFCSVEYRPSMVSRAHGCCLSTAPQHMRATTSGP